MDAERAAFEINSRHTLAVTKAVPAELWDREPGGSVKSLRGQLAHLALVRESICRQIAGEATAGLGEVFETPEWKGEDLAAAFAAHAERCRSLLDRVDPATLDAPFTTPFGNRSTSRNYLRCMLVEEVHHRAQMTCVLRLLGVTPPPFPGKAWVELGVEQHSKD